LIFSGSSILLLCMAMIGGAILARHQANKIIAEFSGLDAVTDPSATAVALMRKYRNRLVDSNCQSDLCQYQFLFTNKAISIFRVVPKAEIRAYVTMNRGALSVVDLDYTSDVFKAQSPIVGVQEDFCVARGFPSCNYFYVDPHGSNVLKTWNGNVMFGQMATLKQRRAAWALNPDCFTAWRGCTNISQLLPTIWKLTSPVAVSSRMRSMADSIADAAQPLPE
jgi:hypothetical protein